MVSTITSDRAGTGFRAGGVFLALALTLGGCSGLQIPKFGFGKKKPVAEAGPEAASRSVKLVERDVEAPGIFQVTGPALWDGRPSLGGVWVAYPGQVQPERVIIRNESNKKFVIGALFRRERQDPGPKIQLSSEAAAALGVLAGKPTVLNVTALRRESVPAKTTAATAPAAPASNAHPAAKTAKSSVQSIASAAIAKAEGKAAKTKPSKAAVKTAAAPRPAVSKLAKPYIQIGIFSIEQNAKDTATSLRMQGVVPIIKAQTSRNKKFWRVLVGPATSKSERTILLDKAHVLGFGDAYFVTR